MDIWQVVSQVTDWLIEKHGTRGRSSYNYMYVLSVAAGVGSWVASKEAKVAGNLQFKPISVTSFSQENGMAIKVTGTLVQKDGMFIVTLVRQDDVSNIESSSGALHSLDDVDGYLRTHTTFVLADFRI
jgi:hypothetical protein